MPTPFQHLNYARILLETPGLPAAVRERLQHKAGAFFLGSTAADVQSLTGQPRPLTHFFTVPPTDHTRAEVALLRTYPQLADPNALTPDHAAFLSGYLLHLVWDQRWAQDIYLRYYWHCDDEPLICAVKHNALRVLLDRQAESTLQEHPTILTALHNVQPGEWLPFVAATTLQAWQEWIVEQLAQPGTAQTAAVFAARNGVAVEQLEQAVRRLQVQLQSSAMPALRQAIADYEIRARYESLAALRRFWRRAGVSLPDTLSWTAAALSHG